MPPTKLRKMPEEQIWGSGEMSSLLTQLIWGHLVGIQVEEKLETRVWSLGERSALEIKVEESVSAEMALKPRD